MGDWLVQLMWNVITLLILICGVIGSSGAPGSSIMTFQWLMVLAEAAELVRWFISAFTLVYCGVSVAAGISGNYIAFESTCFGSAELAAWSSKLQLSVAFVVMSLVVMDVFCSACLNPVLTPATSYFSASSA
eukprot:4528139-Amphidinium_carterae.1